MAEEKPDLVAITAANTFLATHVIKQLLEEECRVRGLVPSLENEDQLSPLKDLAKDAAHPLDLVALDPEKDDSLDEAFKDVAFVLHTDHLSVRGGTLKGDDAVKTATDQMTKVLQACQRAKVKRLVITSTASTVLGATGEPNKTYTEEDWVDPEKTEDVSVRAGVAAEKAALEFNNEVTDDEKFDVVIVNPVLMLGPVLTNAGTPIDTSLEIAKKLLEHGMQSLPKLFLCVTDVREVAAALVKAMTSPDANGQRHIVSSTGVWLKEMAQTIAEEFKPQGYNVPTMNKPKAIVRVHSLFSKSAKSELINSNKQWTLDTTRMREKLQISPRDLKETLIETCYSLIELGFVKKSKKYRGPKKEADEEEKKEEEEEKPVNGEVAQNEEAAEAEKAEEKQPDEAKADDAAAAHETSKEESAAAGGGCESAGGGDTSHHSGGAGAESAGASSGGAAESSGVGGGSGDSGSGGGGGDSGGGGGGGGDD